jgi:hypothetical protein
MKMKPDKISILTLLVLLGGILLLGLPGLIRDGRAAESDAEDCLVRGIFYDEDHPRVLINEGLFTVNSSCCGGKITGIFPDYVVLEFPYGKREYKPGNTIRREKVQVPTPKPAPGTAPRVQPPYVSYANKVNSLVEDFMASHNQQNAAVDMRMKKSLFANPDEAGEIRVRAARMLELIQEKKQELSAISVPENCRRQYSLAVKLLDIAEDGWKKVSVGDKDKAEVFFERLLKVSQELSRESVSILAR